VRLRVRTNSGVEVPIGDDGRGAKGGRKVEG